MLVAKSACMIMISERYPYLTLEKRCTGQARGFLVVGAYFGQIFQLNRPSALDKIFTPDYRPSDTYDHERY